MLKTLTVKSLFGLYTYELDFTNRDGSTIKFITGPNGYGKTTVLSLIYALYTCDFKVFMDIPFGELLFDFESESVHIQRQPSFLPQDAGSDETKLTDVELTFVFLRNLNVSEAGNEEIERFTLNANNPAEWEQKGQNLRLYLHGLPCYYIRDQRLLHKGTRPGESAGTIQMTVSAVQDNADDLAKRMGQQDELLSEPHSLLEEFDKMGYFNKDKYEQKRRQLQPLFDDLHHYGFSKQYQIPDYNSGKNIPQLIYFMLMEDKATVYRPLLHKLRIFEKIIKRCQFAHKHVEIGPEFGYRFVISDDKATILPLDKLSSGEQHILIQTYELLFRAEDKSLVLMDEPELSFHLAWQIDFLRNMQTIVEERQIQSIIGTHSPQVFNNDWDLSVDLYTQSKSFS